MLETRRAGKKEIANGLTCKINESCVLILCVSGEEKSLFLKSKDKLDIRLLFLNDSQNKRKTLTSIKDRLRGGKCDEPSNNKRQYQD